jgi:hypothetical protein
MFARASQAHRMWSTMHRFVLPSFTLSPCAVGRSAFLASVALVWLVWASVKVQVNQCMPHRSLPAELNYMILTAISRGVGSAATDTVQSQHKRNPIAKATQRKRGIEHISTLTFVVLRQHDRMHFPNLAASIKKWSSIPVDVGRH